LLLSLWLDVHETARQMQHRDDAQQCIHISMPDTARTHTPAVHQGVCNQTTNDWVPFRWNTCKQQLLATVHLPVCAPHQCVYTIYSKMDHLCCIECSVLHK
jgi:hypothetical protein